MTSVTFSCDLSHTWEPEERSIRIVIFSIFGARISISFRQRVIQIRSVGASL